MAGEGCDDSCALSVSRTWREVWDSSYAILVLTVHSNYVMVIKYSMSLKTKESCMWTKRKEWYASVTCRSIDNNRLCWVLKWNEENILPYELRNNFVCMM